MQSLSGVRVSAEMPSATYCVVLDSAGEFKFGVGDMDITNQLSVDWVGPQSHDHHMKVM